MSKDIFGHTMGSSKGWRLGRAMLTLPGSFDKLAVTNVTIGYGLPVQSFSPINQTAKYIVAGEPEGGLTIGLMVGPSASIKAFVEQYSDICKINGNTMTIKPAGDLEPCPGVDGGSPDEFVLSGVHIHNIQLSAAMAQQAGGINLTSATLTATFLSLQLK